MTNSPNRFRTHYRVITDEQHEIVHAIKEIAETLARAIETQGSCLVDQRMKALALTNLEQAVMWAVKAHT